MSELQEKLDAAIWSAHTLFQKGLVSGSTGNISFLHEHRMYISRSGAALEDCDRKISHRWICREQFCMESQARNIPCIWHCIGKARNIRR